MRGPGARCVVLRADIEDGLLQPSGSVPQNPRDHRADVLNNSLRTLKESAPSPYEVYLPTARCRT